MTFTPFKHYSINTTLPVKEVIGRLEEDVFPGGTSILNSNPDTIKLYRGTVKNHQFKIIRIPKSLQRRIPVIVLGKVISSSDHTIIEIVMRPTFSTLFFFTFFVIFYLIGTVNYLIQMGTQHNFDSGIFLILPAFAIMYLISILMINDEEKRFKQFMHDLLI